MRNTEPQQWPVWRDDEERDLDFIDWVILPLCFCLLIPIAAFAVCLNLWDWVKNKR